MKHFIIIALSVFSVIVIMNGCSRSDAEPVSTLGNIDSEISTQDISERVDPPNVFVISDFNELDKLISLSDASDDAKSEYLKGVDEMQTGIRGVGDLNSVIGSMSRMPYISVESDLVKISSITFYPEYGYAETMYCEPGSPYWNIRITSYLINGGGNYNYGERSFRIGDLVFKEIVNDDAGRVSFVCTDTEHPISIIATKDMEEFCITELGGCSEVKRYIPAM